ncbi:MAG: hypothetical protein AYL31_009990, partial [Candidatus Bathyarchaeota archaeon B26-1]
MWKRISEFLKDYPERLSVARILVKNGLSIRDGKVYCNEIPVPIAGISRAAGVDRRTVMKTIEMIESNEELRRIFKGIRSAGTSLKEIARHLNLGVVEITPEDARLPGILARSASLLADRNISIRQAIVDDP